MHVNKPHLTLFYIQLHSTNLVVAFEFQRSQNFFGRPFNVGGESAARQVKPWKCWANWWVITAITNKTHGFQGRKCSTVTAKDAPPSQRIVRHAWLANRFVHSRPNGHPSWGESEKSYLFPWGKPHFPKELFKTNGEHD